MTRACLRRGTNKDQRIKKKRFLLKVPCSRRGRRHSPGQGAGPTRRAGAELRQTRRISKPRAVKPHHRASTAPGARLGPQEGSRGRSFCSPAQCPKQPHTWCPRAAAGGAHRRPGAPILHFSFPPLQRVGSPPPQRCLVPLVNYRGWAAAPGTILHTPGNPPSLPEGSQGGGDLHTSAGRQPTPRPRRPAPPYRSLVQINLFGSSIRREKSAARRLTKSSAADGRSPRSRHFPQPARARTRWPPQPRHFRFQKRSSFKVTSARPVGRRPPSQVPILRPRLRRVTNKFREPVRQPPLEPVGLRTRISGSLRALRSLPDGHHVCPRRFPPPPPHAHKEWAT